VAVTVESAFVLIDKASGPLKKIQAQAMLTNKALKDMSGSGTGAQGWQKQFTSTTQSIGQMSKATSDLQSVTKDAGNTVSDTSKKVKQLGSDVERTRGFFSRLRSDVDNTVRSFVKGHPAIANFGGAVGGALGGVKGLVTALPLLATAAIAAAPAIVALGGAVGALVGSLSFAAAGGAALGGGLLGSFAVGLGSVVAVAKPAITQLKSYRTAVQQLQTAEQSGSATAVKAAQARLDAINKANPGVAKLSQNLSGLESAWKKASAPGRQALFSVANDSLETLRKQLSWLGPEADKNTKAVADAFKTNILPIFNSKVFKDFIQTLGSIFRTNLPGFTKGLANIFDGVANVLKVLAPQLKTFGGGFERLTKRFDDWTSSSKGQSSIKLMGEEFKQWGRILGGVARILGDLLGAGARSSQNVVKGWADSVNKFADQLGGKGGTKGVQNFFQQSLQTAGQLVKPLENIAKSFADLYAIWKPFGSVTESIVRALPPGVIAGAVSLYMVARAGLGARSGYNTVKSAISGFGSRGDSPMRPLYVEQVGLGLGSGGGGGGLGLRGRFANTRLGKRIAGTKWGGKFLGTAEADAVGLAPEAESVVEGAAKGGFLGKLLGGGKTLLTGGLRGAGAMALMTGLPLLSGLIPGGVGRTVNKVVNGKVGRSVLGIGGDALTGAALGSVLPGPGTAIGAGIGAGVGAVSALGWNPFSQKGRDKFVSDMGKTWGAIKDGAGKAWGGIQSAAGSAVGFVKKHWEIAGAIAGPIGLGVTMAIKHFGAIKTFLGGLVGSVASFGKKIGAGFVNGIKSGAKTVAGAASSVAHTVAHGATSAAGAVAHGASSLLHGAISFFGADGGTVPYHSNVLVGEAGPEVLSLPRGSRVTPLSGPNAWPQFGMQTGSPVRLPQPGPTPGGGGIGGILGSSLGIDFSPQGIGQLVNSIHGLTNALTGRDSLQSALQDVGNEFDDLSNSAQNDWQDIESATKSALDNISSQLTNANDALSKNYDTLISNIQKAMNNGVTATQAGVSKIFEAMAKAFQTLGVSSNVSSRLAKAGFGGGGGKAKKNATGGRLPGEPQGDHLPLLGRGGSLLGIADGGELVVNRHTEGRVNAKLAAFGTTLGKEVAGETRPHFANGGRIPRFATGGAVGEVNQFFSSRGWDKTAIAGLLGNAMQESSLNPNTPGGGMWQQISNFGSSSGGSLQNQMMRMYPQVASLRNSMNSSTPGGAATIFEQNFERAGIPALANRIKYAQEAYAGKLGAITGGAGGFGGTVPRIATPKIAGLLPGEIAQLGQASLNAVAAAANGVIQKAGLRAAGVGGAGAAPMSGPKAVQAMVREADRIASHTYNYEWGGGHNGAFAPTHGEGHGSGPGVGYDCSGAVSAVLHSAGLLNSPLTSGPLMTWGAPGPGKNVTIWASPEHTFMAMNGHYFGTSYSNQGGGAGWIGHFPESMPAVRHPPGLAMGGRVNQWDELSTQEQNRRRRNPYAIAPDKGGFAHGGRIPWYAAGTDFIARRPTIIGVGDGPSDERVTVTPQNQNTTSNRPVSIEIHNIVVNRKGDVQKIVDEEMRLLAQSLGGDV
jgi:phage-related protein